MYRDQILAHCAYVTGATLNGANQSYVLHLRYEGLVPNRLVKKIFDISRTANLSKWGTLVVNLNV